MTQKRSADPAWARLAAAAVAVVIVAHGLAHLTGGGQAPAVGDGADGGGGARCCIGRGGHPEPGPQLIGPGHDQGPGLVDRLGPLGAGTALGDHQRPDRLDRPVPALRRATGPPGLRRPRSAHGIKGVRLALPAAVLAVGA
ncbi:MAG TPA: hypothetical protein VGH77_08070, partial [Streptosporangiaceae bacterium]